MVSFRVNGQLVTLPSTWADVPQQWLPALAEARLQEETALLRLTWLQRLSGLSRTLLARIEADMLRRLSELLSWVWTTELPGGLLTHFEHEGTRYVLVEPQLTNCNLSEYTLADHHVRRFGHGHIDALAGLVATVCRPQRAELNRADPAWDGDEREPFNARIAQERTAVMARLPLGLQQLVLAHYLAGARQLLTFYKELFDVGDTSGSAGQGNPLVDMAYSVADAGSLGTFEQVCKENIYTVLEYLDSNRRRRDQ